MLEAIARTGGRARHRRAPGVAAPRRRDAGGDDPSRDPAAGDRPVVAGAPAQLPAARDARGSHRRRCALAREAARQRRRWQRLRAAVRYKERRDRLVGSDEEDALEEAAVIDAELAGAGRRDRLPGRDLLLDPRPARGTPRASSGSSSRPAADFHALTNATVVRGRHLALPGFTSTLPLGVDRAAARRAATRSATSRTASPLTSSRCGCPDGLILGTADPGGTLERLDPYDRQFATTLTLIVGKGGGGKTVTSILLACRFIAQGGRIYITDRQLHPRRPRRHAPAPGTTTRCCR